MTIILGTELVLSTCTGPKECSSWQEIASEKRRTFRAKIPNEWILPEDVLSRGRETESLVGDFLESLLDSETLSITSMDAATLLRGMESKEFTTLQVISAFCKRATFAHQLNNNLLDIGFSAAQKRARELDQYIHDNGRLIGPLHGLPYSMKDQFHIKGFETTMAYVGWIDAFEGQKHTGLERQFQSEMANELELLGAIPIAKTTLVQVLSAGETNNNITGYTWNPRNQALSCGGSSGEGAFQALRGSAIGFGLDSGGSVTIPAAFNGVYGLKPSHGRLPMKSVANGSPGQTIIPTVVGMLGPSIDSLKIVLQALLSTKPWIHDPEVINLPWRDSPEDKSRDTNTLCFGLFENDGMVTPHPPISRALQITAAALKKSGHQVLPWFPPSHAQARDIHRSIIRADGKLDVLKNIALSGEPLVAEAKRLFQGGIPKPIPLPNFYEIVVQLRNFRAKYQEYWEPTAKLSLSGRPVDAVIMPVSPHAGVIPGKYYHYVYSSSVNVIDYTTVVVPVTTANKSLDITNESYVPMNDVDELNWKAYDRCVYHGAPASIQIMGRRLEEEKILGIAQIVIDAIATTEVASAAG